MLKSGYLSLISQRPSPENSRRLYARLISSLWKTAFPKGTFLWKRTKFYGPLPQHNVCLTSGQKYFHKDCPLNIFFQKKPSQGEYNSRYGL